MDQYFRLQYHPNKLLTPSDSSKKYWDVYPANAKSAIIRDLDPGVEYSIDVMSINNLGESNFTFKPVIVTTSIRSSREQKQLLLENGEQLGVYIIAIASVAAVFFVVFLIVLTAYMCRKSKR